MNERLTILQGDVMEQLATLPDNSVHCCVTMITCRTGKASTQDAVRCGTFRKSFRDSQEREQAPPLQQENLLAAFCDGRQVVFRHRSGHIYLRLSTLLIFFVLSTYNCRKSLASDNLFCGSPLNTYANKTTAQIGVEEPGMIYHTNGIQLKCVPSNTDYFFRSCSVFAIPHSTYGYKNGRAYQTYFDGIAFALPIFHKHRTGSAFYGSVPWRNISLSNTSPCIFHQTFFSGTSYRRICKHSCTQDKCNTHYCQESHFAFVSEPIELNPAYVELIKARCNVTPGLVL